VVLEKQAFELQNAHFTESCSGAEENSFDEDSKIVSEKYLFETGHLDVQKWVEKSSKI
jgi:hypothetical protein